MSIKLLSAEQAVEMAHKLYEMRRAAKQIDGDKYPASIEVHLEAIRRLEKKDGEGYLSAFIRLAKDVTDKFGARGTGTVLRLAAAAMELEEAQDRESPQEKARRICARLGLKP
jgi:hypothetical protein